MRKAAMACRAKLDLDRVVGADVRRLSMIGIKAWGGGAQRLAVAAGALALSLATGPAGAVAFHPDTLKDEATIPSCAGGAYRRCTSQAYITATSLSSDNSSFEQGFNAWNANQEAGEKWTLEYGGTLPASTLSIVDFQAIAEDPWGGMLMDVNWSYGGADKEEYVWTQALFVNYVRDETPTGTIVDPYFTLDTYKPLSNEPPCDNQDSTALVDHHYCGPTYPIQYGNRRFYDRPRGPWPNSHFDAYAMLSKVDEGARILTVYEGIGWGFQLDANDVIPEPGAWMLMLGGFAMTGQMLRGSRAVARRA